MPDCGRLEEEEGGCSCGGDGGIAWRIRFSYSPLGKRDQPKAERSHLPTYIHVRTEPDQVEARDDVAVPAVPAGGRQGGGVLVDQFGVGGCGGH